MMFLFVILFRPPGVVSVKFLVELRVEVAVVVVEVVVVVVVVFLFSTNRNDEKIEI